jgi:hypothetical protein
MSATRIGVSGKLRVGFLTVRLLGAAARCSF